MVVWPLAFLACFALLAAFIGSSSERRPHFWRRALLVAGVPAALPLLATIAGIAPQLALGSALSLVVGPALLYQPSRGNPGTDDGPGNDPAPAPSGPPPSGIPLPDADQSRARVRDHRAAARRARVQRRAVPEPQHPRVPSR